MMSIVKTEFKQKNLGGLSSGKHGLRSVSVGVVLIALLLLPGYGAAQGMPVYDNTNFISLAKQLIESGKQTSNLLKTVEFLKKQKDRIEQVSDVVRQLSAVQDLIANNKKLIGMVRGDLREVLNSPFIKPDEINRVTRSFNEILERSMET